MTVLRDTIGGLVLVALAGGCSLGRLWEPSQADTLRHILPSAAQIIVQQPDGRRVRTGSGVVLASGSGGEDAPQCFVLTSAHTVADVGAERELFVVLGQPPDAPTKLKATVAAARATNAQDIALLRVRSNRCTPAQLGEPPMLGDPVWVVSFPMGRPMTLASGVVSQVGVVGIAEPEMASRLMVDAPVSYGSSGGGVYAARGGGLIGIIEGYSTARLSAQGVTPSWFIDVPIPGHTLVTPLSDIRQFLTESGRDQLLGSSARSRQP